MNFDLTKLEDLVICLRSQNKAVMKAAFKLATEDLGFDANGVSLKSKFGEIKDQSWALSFYLDDLVTAHENNEDANIIEIYTAIAQGNLNQLQTSLKMFDVEIPANVSKKELLRLADSFLIDRN